MTGERRNEIAYLAIFQADNPIAGDGSNLLFYCDDIAGRKTVIANLRSG